MIAVIEIGHRLAGVLALAVFAAMFIAFVGSNR